MGSLFLKDSPFCSHTPCPRCLASPGSHGQIRNSNRVCGPFECPAGRVCVANWGRRLGWGGGGGIRRGTRLMHVHTLPTESCRQEGAPLTRARFTVTPAAPDTEMAVGYTWPQT